MEKACQNDRRRMDAIEGSEKRFLSHSVRIETTGKLEKAKREYFYRCLHPGIKQAKQILQVN